MCVMRRTLLITLIGPLSALMLAAPAGADSEQDRQFISALRSAGWTINSASMLISQGHMVCNEGLAHGVSWQEMRSSLMGSGYSKLDSSTLISKAVSVYCPERADAIAGLETDSGGAGGGDRDDLFVQQLKRNQNISIDKGAAVDMAKTACDAPLAGVGLYNAWQRMQQRYPKYDLNTVAMVMSQGVLAYCPGRLR